MTESPAPTPTIPSSNGDSPPSSGWVSLRPRFLDKLAGFLMSSNEVKMMLESVYEAAGEDVPAEDVNFIELEIQAARVLVRALTPEERAELVNRQRQQNERTNR